MYKTTFAHRRAAKNGDNDWLSTKLHFFFASYKLFQDDRSSFDFFCNFVGREGGVSDMRFHQNRSDMPLACFKCVDTLPINADLPPPNMLNR